MKYLKIVAVSVGACWLACAALPALAQSSADYDQRAVNAYNAGLDEQDAGHYASACQAFRDAAGLWENAIYGLMGQSMETETARENIKSVADSMQGNVDKAKSHAQNVCGQPDAAPVYDDVHGPAPVIDPVKVQTDVDELNAQLADAADSSQEAYDYFIASRYGRACAAGQLAASRWDVALLEANDLVAASHDTTIVDATRIERSQKAAESYATDIYCKAAASSLADGERAAAVAGYFKASLPSLLAMQPFFDKSPAERAAAFKDTVARGDACSDAGLLANQVDEKGASMAGYTCLAAAKWLTDDEANTCYYSQYVEDVSSTLVNNDAGIAASFTALDVQGIRNRLIAAAGCAQKTHAYWAQVTLDDYYRLLAADAPQKAVIADQCTSAGSLSSWGSHVATAAYQGCMAVQAFADNKRDDACDKLDEGMKSMIEADASDVLSGALSKLQKTFVGLYSAMSCASDSRPAKPARVLDVPEPPRPPAISVKR